VYNFPESKKSSRAVKQNFQAYGLKSAWPGWIQIAESSTFGTIGYKSYFSRQKPSLKIIILIQEQTLKYVFSPEIGDLVRGLNGYLSADSPQLRVLNVGQRKLLRDISHLSTKYSESKA
jgi:hypothetical protein